MHNSQRKQKTDNSQIPRPCAFRSGDLPWESGTLELSTLLGGNSSFLRAFHTYIISVKWLWSLGGSWGMWWLLWERLVTERGFYWFSNEDSSRKSNNKKGDMWGVEKVLSQCVKSRWSFPWTKHECLPAKNN